jgi:ABC-type glycerol-3-phosphate transport system substrate-binding protein
VDRRPREAADRLRRQATPDAAQLGNTWVPELVALGALAPLDEPIAASSEVDPGDYFAGVWDTNVVDGTVWGLPWYVDTRVLFYRTDLVAGGPWPPRSWGEWRLAMERIRDAGGPGRHAILLPIDEWPQPVILALQQGAPLLADGGRAPPSGSRAFAARWSSTPASSPTAWPRPSTSRRPPTSTRSSPPAASRC